MIAHVPIVPLRYEGPKSESRDSIKFNSFSFREHIVGMSFLSYTFVLNQTGRGQASKARH